MQVDFRPYLIAALFVLYGAPASAQVCKETTQTSGSDKANVECDMRYRDAVITCDTKNTGDVVGTRPSCPKKPMPMIRTPRWSYVSDYTPYLYNFARDATDPTRPYAGPYSVGTPGDTSKTFQLFGNTAPGTKRLAGCTTQIKVPEDPTSVSGQARLLRLQLDNCTNQYILNTSLYPFQKANTQLLSLDDPANPSKLLDLQGECQPLRTFRETENEYSASQYLEVAWKKMMVDANYRKTTPSHIKCVPCLKSLLRSTKSYPCDREPHLPCDVTGKKTTLENPLSPPDPVPEVLLSAISAVPYEEILDPTHPFSPRWDFIVNDRDYSNPSASWASVSGLENLALIYGMLQIYMSETEDVIFCAGIKDAKNESDADKKHELEVRVDVLEFRRPAFESALKRRTTYNSVCYEHEALFTSGTDAMFYVAPLSFCFQITGFSMWYPWIFARDFDCWDCFGLSGKVDDESSHPPCTHNYLGKDKKMTRGLPGGLNLFSRSAQCNYPLQRRDGKYNMDKVCRDLRRPYTNLNKLKMRYHNPADKDDTEGKNVVLKDGVQEGLLFSDYFDNHMPYPRLWDTGASLQRVYSTDGNDQPPLDTTGQHTAIVGVGREAPAKVASDASSSDADGKKPADKFFDERCKTGGWGGAMKLGIDLINPSSPTGVDHPMQVGGVTFTLPDPVSSWTELKLYQARTQRNTGLSCLGRYEKVFKPGAAENMILLATGAEWSRLTISKCPRLADGKTGDCSYMTLKEYKDASEPESDDTTLYMRQLQNQAWPNAWRGYMSTTMTGDLSNGFPLFGSGAAVTLPGLENNTADFGGAQPGDIILLPTGPTNELPAVDKIGLAKLALVIESNTKHNSDCETRKNCYVKVMEPDNGKWPDVCGTTDTWGEMKTRYYYKPALDGQPSHLPQEAADEYTRIGSIKTCEDSRISPCEQTAWDTLAVYRIRYDDRKGCENKEKAIVCEKDEASGGSGG